MDSFIEKKWFVYINDRHEGPFSFEEIQGKMSEGLVHAESYVWTDGMQDWKIMTEIEDFNSVLNPSTLAGRANAHPAGMNIEPVVLLESPVTEEKTGDMNVEELVQVQKMAIPSSSPEVSKNRRSFPALGLYFKVFRWLLFLTFLVGASLAYRSGYLDLSRSKFQTEIEKTTDAARPYLLILLEKLPFLSQWISPIPSLPDVTHEDFEELKGAAREKLEVAGPKISLALSRADPLLPAFYLASNLPDGARFHLWIMGKGDTLLNHLSFETQTDVVLEKKLGKTQEIRLSDGKSLPRGEYMIYVSFADLQPQQVKPFQGLIAGLYIGSSTLLPKNTKVIAQKPYFLGGPKDSAYFSRLKDYHEKLQLKVSGELNEIKQFTATLGSQLESTKTKFSLVKKGKVSIRQKKLWSSFHSDWAQLESQLDQIFNRWTPDVIRTDYFYSVLYRMTQQLGQEIEKVHRFHDAFFGGVLDLKAFDIQLGAALSSAESALSLLKAKIDQAKNLQPTLNGMPRREGL